MVTLTKRLIKNKNQVNFDVFIKNMLLGWTDLIGIILGNFLPEYLIVAEIF